MSLPKQSYWNANTKTNTHWITNKNTKSPSDAIAIAIAEEIQGLHKSSASFELLSFLWLWQEVFQKAEKLLAKVKENSEPQILKNLPILCNPWISSVMAMAMSIYRTLCVLVFLKISLLEMLIAVGNEIRFQSSDFRKHEIRFQKSFFRNQTSDINARDVPS